MYVGSLTIDGYQCLHVTDFGPRQLLGEHCEAVLARNDVIPGPLKLHLPLRPLSMKLLPLLLMVPQLGRDKHTVTPAMLTSFQ